MMVLPDAVGLSKEGREHLLSYAATVFNMFGPDNELRRAALAQIAPHVEWIALQCKRDNARERRHRSSDPRRRGRGRGDAAGGGAAGAFDPQRRIRHHRARHRRGDALVSPTIRTSSRRCAPTPRRRALPSRRRSGSKSPVQTFFRTTTRDVALGGAPVPAGAKVLMLLGAAIRDPRKWPHAESYDIERSTAGHVGFGAGVHMCVGQLLARLEGEALLAALAALVADARARQQADAAVQQYAARLGAAAGEGNGRVARSAVGWEWVGS